MRRTSSIVVCCAVLLTTIGCGYPSLLITPVQNATKLQEETLEQGRDSKIALISLDGMLANGKEGGMLGLSPGENPLSLFTQQLQLAEKDPKVKAVVLRINSPGGTVTCSDTIYEQITRFRKSTHKPVVASFQEVAASGAYYLACASDRIVAQPTSVVGSVGVIFYTFNIEGTLNKIGARSEALKSGPLKDMGSPFRAATPQDKAVMQGMIDEYYARFLAIVNENRKSISPESMKMIGDGRVFSGRQAKELGMVDELGLLDDAINTAEKLARADGARVITYRRAYGYGGSIYASAEFPQQQPPNVTRLELPGASHFLPTGFYYLWNP
jgi:protease-4